MDHPNNLLSNKDVYSIYFLLTLRRQNMFHCNKKSLNNHKTAPPIIRGSYLSQSQSNRSIYSAASVRLSTPQTSPRTASSRGKRKKKSLKDDQKREGSYSGSNYSNSEDDNGEYQSSHTCSNFGSDDGNNDLEDDDDEDDSTTTTGALGTRLSRFCWALCCACSDCCRCEESCSSCSCCRSRNITRDELSGIEIENGVLMYDVKDTSGRCRSCVGCLERTWTRWIKLKTYVRDKVEFAENGKIMIHPRINHFFLEKDDS